MKISIVNGICVKNDAISARIYDEVLWLKKAGHDVRLFCYACEFDEIDFIRVENPTQLLLHPFFQQSERVVFHFGIFYNLFDCIFACPNGAKKVVVFHNITPGEFLTEQQRPLIRKSYDQMANCSFADIVICDSEVNKVLLKEHGITCDSTVIPISLSTRRAPRYKPSFSDGIVRLLFVGRFVQSKNPGHVLSVLDRAAEAFPNTKFECTLIGNASFSDKSVLKQVEEEIRYINERCLGRVSANLITDATDELKWECYEKSDIFILPSLHEGFCVPVLEALSQGCRVITYDNSNLRFIGGDLTELVPTNDLEKLFLALKDGVTIVVSDIWKKAQYRTFVLSGEEWLKNFDEESVKNRFISFLDISA